MKKIVVGGVGLELLHIPDPVDAAHLAPLVFLHEGLGSVEMWRDWPLQICQASGREGWVYSRQGYGQSDPVANVRAASCVHDGQRSGRLLPDYMHQHAQDVLPALLQQLDLKAPVLLGHSDGASIALLYASRHPLSGCIVMAPHVLVQDISVQAIARARIAFEQGDLRERLRRYHADVDCAFWQWNDVWLSPAFRSFDIRTECARIGAPVLAIQGMEDPYGTMLQIDDIDLPATQIQRVRLLACGHSPHRDQALLTAQHVCSFLTTVP